MSSSSSTGSPPPPRDPDHTRPLRPPLERDSAAATPSHPESPSRGSSAADTTSVQAREPEYAGAQEPEYAGERAPSYAEESAYQGDPRYDRGQEPSTLPREEDFYSGVKIGSAFFGWLTATAMLILISGMLSGIGVSLAVATRTTTDQLTSSVEADPRTAAIVGGIVLVVVVFLASYCGGYVAGRMARFDGVRQGVAVWCWGLLMTLLLWLAVFLLGDRWDPAGAIEGLPTLDVPVSPTSTAGLVVVGVTALIALLASIIGAVIGVRYHRRIDEAMMSR